MDEFVDFKGARGTADSYPSLDEVLSIISGFSLDSPGGRYDAEAYNHYKIYEECSLADKDRATYYLYLGEVKMWYGEYTGKGHAPNFQNDVWIDLSVLWRGGFEVKLFDDLLDLGVGVVFSASEDPVFRTFSFHDHVEKPRSLGVVKREPMRMVKRLYTPNKIQFFRYSSRKINVEQDFWLRQWYIRPINEDSSIAGVGVGRVLGSESTGFKKSKWYAD